MYGHDIARLYSTMRYGMNRPKKAVPSRAAKPASRRKFLQGSGMMLAGGALVGTNLSVARSANAFGSDAIKIGLVGCGSRGTSAAVQALATAACGSGPPVATFNWWRWATCSRAICNAAYRSIKGNHPEQVDTADRRFVGLDAYQHVLECDIDLVILATPPGFRPQQFEAAVQAGKHVFMEKPVATDPAGIRRILAANEIALQKGLAVQVGLQRRHESRYRECIEAVATRCDWRFAIRACLLEWRWRLGSPSFASTN